MTTALLDLFQVTAPTKQERDESSNREDPIKNFRESVNALLAMDAAATRAQASRKRAQKIAAKLDDPTIQGTQEQRGAAEAAAYGFNLEANQATKEEIPRLARRLLKHWPNLTTSDREWFRSVFVAGWSTSPAWSVLDNDTVLSKDKVIRDLILRANRVEEVEVPF